MLILQKICRRWSEEVCQTGLLILLSLMGAVSLLIAVGWIYQLFPLNSKLAGHIAPEWMSLLHPNRDLFFYRTFIVTVFFLFPVLMLVCRHRLGAADFTRTLARLVLVEIFILGFALFALVQYFIYDDVALAKTMLCFWSGLFVLGKIFWRPVARFMELGGRLFEDARRNLLLNRAADFVFPAVIFLLIWVPDFGGLSARIFNEDLYYHFDGVIMSSSWATLKGGIPSLDMVNSYGVGLPMVVGALTRVWGGFSYENVLAVLIALTILYFAAGFLFLRVWLKNTFLAIAGVLLAIKLQMFHYGADPFLWKYPNGIVVRYFFDIIFFLLLLGYGRSKKVWVLFLAAVVSGFAVFYVSDSGIYLIGTYFAYVLMVLLVPQHREFLWASRRDVFKIAGLMALPILTTLGCLTIVLKGRLWDPVFWRNLGEQMALFSQGFGSIPVSENFKSGNSFAFLAGCGILLVYLLAVFIPAGRWFRYRKIDLDDILAASIGIYGVLFFQYYICQATAARYFCTCVPYVVLICYGLNKLLRSMENVDRQKISAVCALGAGVLLVTTRLFIQYPNVLTSRGGTFTDDRKKMAAHAPAREDVHLIRLLTSPDEKVCLIASNETLILMQADRKPFFYYFPLVNSRGQSGLDFGGLYLFTKERLAKTLLQLQNEKPRYVFVEAKVFNRKLPGIYYQNYQSMTAIMNYLSDRYVPVMTGKHILVLGRKDF